MGAHVLLNVLNELVKSDKMRGLPSILSGFSNEFDKFNNTEARMLDSIYYMSFKVIHNRILAWKHQDFAIFYSLLYRTPLRNVTKIVNH